MTEYHPITFVHGFNHVIFSDNQKTVPDDAVIYSNGVEMGILSEIRTRKFTAVTSRRQITPLEDVSTTQKTGDPINKESTNITKDDLKEVSNPTIGNIYYFINSLKKDEYNNEHIELGRLINKIYKETYINETTTYYQINSTENDTTHEVQTLYNLIGGGARRKSSRRKSHKKKTRRHRRKSVRRRR